MVDFGRISRFSAVIGNQQYFRCFLLITNISLSKDKIGFSTGSIYLINSF